MPTTIFYAEWQTSINGRELRTTRRYACFYKAIELDPGFGSAYGMAAWCYVWRKLNGWVIDEGKKLPKAPA